MPAIAGAAAQSRRTREEIEAALRDYLGATEVIWLENGIAGDDTHGHIDDLARFANRDTVVTVVEPDRAETNYSVLQENLSILRARKDLETVTLPMPEPVYSMASVCQQLCQFYVANRLVLVPNSSTGTTALALDTIARLFPDREIVGIPATDCGSGSRNSSLYDSSNNRRPQPDIERVRVVAEGTAAQVDAQLPRSWCCVPVRLRRAAAAMVMIDFADHYATEWVDRLCRGNTVR